MELQDSTTSYFSSLARTPRMRGGASVEPRSHLNEAPASEAAELLSTLGWVEEYREKIDRLVQTVSTLEKETSEDDWDGERGEAISSVQWVDAVLTLVAVVLDAHLPLPHVGASGDGFVHLTWFSTGGDRLLIEVGRGEFVLSRLPVEGADTVREFENTDDLVAAVLAEQFPGV